MIHEHLLKFRASMFHQEQKESLEEKELEPYFSQLKTAFNTNLDFSSNDQDHQLSKFLHKLCSELSTGNLFDLLPEESVWNCMSFLHVVDIVRVGQVSKKASRACESQVLWEILLFRDFDVSGNPNIDGDGRPNVVYSSIYKQISRTRKQRFERFLMRKKKNSEIKKSDRSESW
jgi:hypothetical protein